MMINLQCSSLGDSVCKAFDKASTSQHENHVKNLQFRKYFWSHSAPLLDVAGKDSGLINTSKNTVTHDGVEMGKMKRPKLKGKRAVVRWLKFFRYKKRKEYKRMTEEEKFLYKLRKAEKKEERLVESLKKLEPGESSETTHDPEILTPEEHFFFLKMGLKCKNYVPVGRRGIYQGVILNMHLHWKKHQTLQVIVKTFSPDEVKEIAAELARLTGGIVLAIHEEDTIIMYRGKNYSQPPTEIMSPSCTLSRKKALDKSKCRDAIRAVRKYIPKLKQGLELLKSQAERKVLIGTNGVEYIESTRAECVDTGTVPNIQTANSRKLKEIIDRSKERCEDDDGDVLTDLGMETDSEDLSDLFETDSDTEDSEDKAKLPLYLEEFDKFPAESKGEAEDFEEHLRQISADSRKGRSGEEDVESPDFDEVDRLFLRAATLLKKKKR